MGALVRIRRGVGKSSMNSRLPHKLLNMTFVLTVLSCLWGCQGRTSTAASVREDDKIKPSEKLIVDPDRRLTDVPIPLGAHFKAGSSRSYETGSRRRVNHSYGIWAKKSLVRVFFRDNMPIHGWKLTNSVVGSGTYDMNYRKGQESCRVRVGPRNWCLQTQIEITIQPVKDFN